MKTREARKRSVLSAVKVFCTSDLIFVLWRMKCNGFAHYFWEVEERSDSYIFHQRLLFQYSFVPPNNEDKWNTNMPSVSYRLRWGCCNIQKVSNNLNRERWTSRPLRGKVLVDCPQHQTPEHKGIWNGNNWAVLIFLPRREDWHKTVSGVFQVGNW